MPKYILFDSNLVLSLNGICTSVMFTHFLNASVIQYPTMMRNKHDWATSLERTFFTFIAFALVEMITDIYVVYKLRKEEDFEYYLRLSGLSLLTIGWLVSIAFIVPIQLELAYTTWTVLGYNTLLTWNWLRTALWGIRFSMVVFNVVCEIREEEPVALPTRRENGYVSSLDQKNDVFTFEDSDE
tara:strand:- start:1623 stop:2174 length:552 start_codon:yes stop_codon:yes gene_type:complete